MSLLKKYITVVLCIVTIFPTSSLSALTVQQAVNSLQATDPALPSGVANPKGSIGYILSNIFGTVGNSLGKIQAQYIDYSGISAWTQSGASIYLTTTTGSIGIGNISPSYKLDVNGTAKVGRDLYVSGNTGGNYGNRLVVGATDTAYTLQDTNLRPTLQIDWAYPVLSLNHTVTTNSNHGPTIQFTSNGVGSQFVIGANGQGTQLDFGFSSNTDWNPHNGIAGYNGTTPMRIKNNGYVGIGGSWWAISWQGDPAYPLDVRWDMRVTGTIYGNATSANSIPWSGVTNKSLGDTARVDSTLDIGVSQYIRWKNYGNNHVIIDASNSTTPSGTAINNTNSAVAWSASYPTLMGWNGSSTYGVRVDSARTADSAGSATYATYINTDSYNMKLHWSGQWGQPTWLWGSSNGADAYVWNPSNFSVNYANSAGNVTSLAGTWGGLNYFVGNCNTASCSSPALMVYSNGGNGATMSFHRGGYYAVNMGLDSDNVLRIGGWSAAANRWQLDMSGNEYLAWSVSAPAFYYSSDKKLKENIVKIDSPLEKIQQLNGYTFDWKKDGRKDVWVIAQEVEKVFPELVKKNMDWFKTVEYGNLVAPIIEAIKELATKVEGIVKHYTDQQKEIDTLTKQNEQILKRLEVLEKKSK